MARSISSAGLLRLPPATAVLLLSAAFGLASGHALPRQTKTVELYELNVVPFPHPTEAPVLLSDLLRRQGQNTVCGYIGGDPNLPATCSAGSHCVLEKDHGVVGCCPDGGSCSTGIFTGCVDRNSDLQTEINPYVYTCQGSDVCYRNDFAGGYFQFGCGTASSLGTTVETSVDGMTSLVFEESSVMLTAPPTILPEPTSIGSQPSSATDDPDDTSGTSSLSSPDATSTPPATTDPSSTPTSLTSTSLSSSSPSSSLSTSTSTSSSSTTGANTTPSLTTTFGAPPGSTTDPSTSTEATGIGPVNKGAIIGGAIGGAVVFIALFTAAVLFYLRKRRGNDRQGPGPLPTNAPPKTEYVSPIRSHGAAFAPLPSWQDEEEDRQPLTQYNHQPSYPIQEPWQAEPNMALAKTNSASRGFTQPLRYHPATIRAVPPLPIGTELTPVAEEEHSHDQDSDTDPDRGRYYGQVEGPTLSQIDDFSRAYLNAGIGTEDSEEGRRPLTGANLDDVPAGAGATSPEGSRSPTRGVGTGNRPLWQQNRQQGRNLRWV